MNSILLLVISIPHLLLGSPLKDARVNHTCRLQVFTEVFFKYPPLRDTTFFSEIHSIDINRITIDEGKKRFFYEGPSHMKKKHQFLWEKYKHFLLNEIELYASSHPYESQRKIYSKTIIIQPSHRIKKKINSLNRFLNKESLLPESVSHKQRQKIVKERGASLYYILDTLINSPKFYLIETYSSEEKIEDYVMYIYSPNQSIIQAITKSSSFQIMDRKDYDRIVSWIDKQELATKRMGTLLEKRISVFFVKNDMKNQFEINIIQTGYDTVQF